MAPERWDPPRPGWTCPQCQFDYDAVDLTTVADAVRRAGTRYRVPLTRGLRDEDLDAVLRRRPAEDAWSALEYACHVRDVLDLNDDRVERIVADDRPALQAMDPDVLVVERDYNGADAVAVADELAAAAERLAARLDALTPEGWTRAATRNGEELVIEWMARNVLHECEHHLLDIGRTLRSVRGR
jgi:hypothetical protein